MRCHYEVLGIPLNASLDDIKKAYRKCALQWHPDKHPENKEEANVKFLEIQDAYETLSNDQERAWYDAHREVLINGGKPGEQSTDDYVFNIYPYFSSTCFSGFNDNEKGFYTVYRDVFTRIAEEDKSSYKRGEEQPTIPEFGYSDSDYETVVGPFYAFWGSYCTPRSFVWVEKHDVREAEDRYVRRLMDKENKKLRDKAKKERNEEIRKLVDFVRKKDKRVEEYRKILEEKAQLAQKKAKEKKEADRARRAEQMKAYVSPEWSQVDDELAKLDLQYGGGEEEEEDDDEDDDDNGDDKSEESGEENGSEEKAAKIDGDEVEDDEEDNELFCVACNKLFKSGKSFQNHEKSKKHKENVELLRKNMKNEEENFFMFNNSNRSNEEPQDNSNKPKLSKKQKKNKRKQAKAAMNEEGEEDEESSNNEETNNNDNLTKERDDEEKKPEDDDNDGGGDGVKIEVAESGNKASTKQNKKPGKNKPKSSSTATTAESASISTTENLKCQVCEIEFDSRNKLFEHIKTEGHAAPRTDGGGLSHNEIKKNKRLLKNMKK